MSAPANPIDAVLYHKYYYYVLMDPIISDYEFDMLERSLSREEQESLLIGSEIAEQYPAHIVEWVENELRCKAEGS